LTPLKGIGCFDYQVEGFEMSLAASNGFRGKEVTAKEE
jgi:hypothetical protein